ncbi:MAG: helix-turn-helix transcriptional regulator [Clostridia bacterium]|nr:helix-turn-helix transcriptional regulator [Clostridia bacterium]
MPTLFSERITALRKAKGMTQTDLAETLHVSGGTVAMWETGKRTPKAEMLIRIADLFSCTLDYLLGRSDTVNITKSERTEQQCRKIQMTNTPCAVSDSGTATHTATGTAWRWSRSTRNGRRAARSINPTNSMRLKTKRRSPVCAKRG